VRTRFVFSNSWGKPLLGMILALMAVSCDLPSQWVERLPELQPRADAPVSPSTPVQSPQTAQMEEQIRQRINEIRQTQGLAELQANEKLAEVARRYSQQMAEQDFFSHTGSSGDTPAQRVRSAGIVYNMVGENLFKSTNIPQPVGAAVEGWMDSPGHRENILRSQYRETGVGVWQDGETYYVTQLFLRSFGF